MSIFFYTFPDRMSKTPKEIKYIIKWNSKKKNYGIYKYKGVRHMSKNSMRMRGDTASCARRAGGLSGGSMAKLSLQSDASMQRPAPVLHPCHTHSYIEL